MKIKQKTIADKVNELLAKENQDSSDESSTEATEPRVTEFDDEEYELPQAQATEFRKRNVKLLSEQSAKYKGKIASRKELEEEDEEEDYYEASDSENEEALSRDRLAESDDDDDEIFKDFGKKLKEMPEGKIHPNLANDSAESDDGEEEENEADEDEVVSEEKTDDEDEEDDENFDQSDVDEQENVDEHEQHIVSVTNRETEMQKGVCVQNQLRIWEKLLEMRIQSQKILTKANQLPMPETLHAIPNMEAVQTETVQNVGTLLNKLLELQETLSDQYSELRKEVKSRKRTANVVNKEEEPACKQYAVELAQHFKAFRNYRNNVLLKWDDRTKVMTPGAGNKRKSAQEDFDILKKITHALNNRQLLIERAHLMKVNNNATVTADEADAVQPKTQVYDDSDFYHQQLRELIEYKANTTSNMAEVTKQYVELQKLRQKMKKKVDTRASKGRKMRYVVRSKLVNFMAPEDAGTWTEQSKNELYKSLFAA